MSKSGRGFLTFAENTTDTNYLDLAVFQSKWLKASNPNASYAVVVNQLSQQQLTDEHRHWFDHIIPVTNDLNDADSLWKLQNESQVFQLTPFKETIKLEADLIIHRPTEHWWNALEKRPIVLSVGSVNQFGETNRSRHYREFFDLNLLPDVHNGLMYFRYCEEAYQFFELAKSIRENWATVAQTLKRCREQTPSTDVLYAVTALVFGQERVTIPTLNWFRFCHMKPKHTHYPEGAEWFRHLLFETDGSTIRIDNVLQHYPLHYYDKTFCEYYERHYPEPA